MRISILVLVLVIISCISEPSQVELSRKYAKDTKVPEGSDLELGLAGYAKVFCSAIFVSEREPDEAFENSGFFLLPEEYRNEVSYTIDSINKSVSLGYRDSLFRSATYYGNQGCIIDTEEGLQFVPSEISTSLPPANSQNWPMGDLSDATHTELNDSLLQKAVDQAFSDGLTAAFLVLHKGSIIAERYAVGLNKYSQLESWSMGKSLTATLIGRMIQQGYISLEDEAPIEAWSSPGDPRSKITIRNLLQMSSGLHFTSHRDPEAESYTRYLDHMYIYTGAIDAFNYSINRPLQYEVGSKGRYRNCDPLTLGLIIRQTANNNDLNYHSYAQTHLFDKVGIRKQVMETDPHGNFLLTGYDYGTARNWARLGLLYLQDGKWNGEQILPEGWSEFVSTKGDGWERPIYGGMFWLNGEKVYPIPKDSYYMAGGGGQRTIIIPSKEMVVVRMGHFKGAVAGEESLKKSLELLMKSTEQ